MMTKLSTGMQSVITGKYYSVQYIVSYRDGYTCICILLDFSLSVKAATLIFISGCGSAISSPKQGNSGFIYKLVKS